MNKGAYFLVEFLMIRKDAPEVSVIATCKFRLGTARLPVKMKGPFTRTPHTPHTPRTPYPAVRRHTVLFYMIPFCHLLYRGSDIELLGGTLTDQGEANK